MTKQIEKIFAMLLLQLYAALLRSLQILGLLNSLKMKNKVLYSIKKNSKKRWDFNLNAFAICLYRYAKFVCNRLKLVIFSPICTLKLHSLYRTHYINHLAAYGTSLLRSQVAVVALLQIYAHFSVRMFTY